MKTCATVDRSLFSTCLIVVAFAGLLHLCSPSAFGQLSNVDLRTDVVYGHKDGLAMTYDVFAPKKNANGRGLILMVSGGWVSTWMPPQQAMPLFHPFLEAGYTVITVRHGSSPKYLIPEITEDVRKGLEHITANSKDYGIDPFKLGVFGFSAGGHLSLMLGTTTNQNPAEKEGKPSPHVAAVAAIFPPTDLVPYVDPKNPLREQFPALKFDVDKADLYSPLKQVSTDDAPTLLVHGDKDELVPIWHSEKIHEAFEQSKVPSRLVVIEGAAHGFNQEGNQRMFQAMLEWFNEHLK